MLPTNHSKKPSTSSSSSSSSPRPQSPSKSIYNSLPILVKASSSRTKRVLLTLVLLVTIVLYKILLSNESPNLQSSSAASSSSSRSSTSPSDLNLKTNHKEVSASATKDHRIWSSWSLPTSSFWLKLTSSSKDAADQLTTSIGGSTHENWESPTKPIIGFNVSLYDRLKSWRNSPLPEPALWVQFNLQTCSDERVGKNANVDLLKRAHLLWATMNSTHIRNKREELITFLENAERDGKLSPERWGRGRGIVFTAGNVDTFSRVLLTVRMLREHLNCKLPVEIFSFPGEVPDQETRESLESLDVKFRIIGWAQKDSRRSKNFHIKASALVACSFREPLYLDSDNLPAVLAPGVIDSLWKSKGYKKLGALFWPDYWKTHADVPIWLLIGTQCRDEWEQEAGQILIDKSKHLDVLLLSEFMLKDWKYWFQISDGDKDIFRYAMLALRKRWALPGRYLGAAGLSWNTLSGYCGHTMLQHDPSGRPLFVHMNLLKQIPSGITRGTTFKRTRTIDVKLLANETFEDYGVEADMLANADDYGNAIIDAPPPVKRRAALERGIKAFLHGGGQSAICADMKFIDPGLKLEEVEKEKVKVSQLGEEDEGGKWKGRGKTVTRVKSPLKLVSWNDDPRLKDFEDRYFDMGGKANTQGF